MTYHYENRKRPGNCTCSVDEGAGDADHYESCPQCRVRVEDAPLDTGRDDGVPPTKLGNTYKAYVKPLALKIEPPNENEICEIGAHLRDGGLRVSNSDVGTILARFFASRNKPEIGEAAKRAIRCFQGCTLTPEEADEIVKELGYVAHGWISPIRKYPS